MSVWRAKAINYFPGLKREIEDKNFDLHYNDWEWDAVEKINLYPDGIPENYISIWVSTKPVRQLPYEYYFGQFKDDFHITAGYRALNFAYGKDEKVPFEIITDDDPIFSDISESVKKRLSKLGVSEMTYIHVAKEYNYEAENTGIQENEHFLFIGSFKVK